MAKLPMAPGLAHMLLFAAARSDHVERLIVPALDRGDWVICDRFIDSSRAYQGGGGGLEEGGQVHAGQEVRLQGVALSGDQGVAGGVVGHVMEELRFPRPVRPGDTLRVEGCVFRYASTTSNVGILYFAATADLDTYVGNGNVFSKTASQNTAYILSTATAHATLAAWRTASGDDADSVESNAAVPHNALFVAESSYNYRLVASSPAEIAALREKKIVA